MATAPAVTLKFALWVLPYMSSSRQTYLKEAVLNKLCGAIPEEIRFLVCNGDTFEGQFVSSKGLFIGLRSLLRRYCSKNVHMLALEYIGRGDFTVTVISSASIEIEYPTNRDYVLRMPIKPDKFADVNSFRFPKIRTLQDNLNTTLFNLNACDTNALKIEIYIPHQHYLGLEDSVVLEDVDEVVTNQWYDQCQLILRAINDRWKVSIQKFDDQWYIVKGWTEFVRATGVEDLDLIILTTSSDFFHFDVAIYPCYGGTPNCVEKDLPLPRSFVKKVTNEFIQTTSMTIPRTYVGAYCQELDTELHLLVGRSGVYRVSFVRNEEKMVTLQQFIRACELRCGFTLIFSKVSTSQLAVTIYDEDLIALNIV